jgi:hypothetical protein
MQASHLEVCTTEVNEAVMSGDLMELHATSVPLPA